ncbi:S9 family peptidase [Janthinobacterium fluminis]|uniref:S9 family peptidase n=1 Tax=Janthinobacterium fluminis TaxID=2987524 RepID=A0ABT5K3A3_9BURK|nr:S9 family peptidase [Janthinobacterium fluminis]MDC8759452.1 S9 family peptidase [Janthinobacterium fluminis]
MKIHQLKAIALFTALAGAAQASAPLREYRALALSGPGEHIAALESADPGGLAQRPHASVIVRDAASGAIVHEYDPCASCMYTAPNWAPDGRRVAFVGVDAKAGTATLYSAAQGRAVALLSLKGVASAARWSPDGTQVALLATLGARKLSGAVEAGARLVGEIGAEEDVQRIAVAAADGGALRLVSPDDTYIYEYNWTPDGRGFVATGAKGNGDNNWWVAKLLHVDAASGALRVVAAPATQMNLPTVSPDGRSVAFIGGLMSDFGSIGGDVYTVALAGGTPRNITPGFAGTVNGLAWRGPQLLATALVGSDMAALALDPAGGPARTLWSAPVGSSAADGRLSFSADGTMAAAAQEDYRRAAHIVAGRLPQLRPISRDNEGFGPQVSVRNINWRSDEHRVQGWLLGPLEVEAGKTYPMVVIVHGGPAAAASPRYVGPGEQANPLVRELTAQGYFVFMPNPRGSYGQGQAFTRANVRDFGGGDLRDILAGIDAVAKVAPVDPQRLGLMGHSYGGFMTMWGVTHSQRFKAAVAGAGIANWISYYGQNGIDQWMIPFFGASAYDDPAIYRAASPIESIKAAKTPTLVYVGERDVECPPAQSMEFWRGLRAMGVPSSLVIYDGEGHALRKPDNQRDVRRRTLAWFARYLGPASQ